MAEVSAGLLMFRRREGRVEVFLVHPGGPFFKKKDEGVWSIPKGLLEGEEDPLAAARREFEEETGIRPEGRMLELGSIKQKSGKLVLAWAFESEPGWKIEVKSNTFEMEWPPRSGKKQRFPEVDRGEFFNLEQARRKINPAQIPLLDRMAGSFD